MPFITSTLYLATGIGSGVSSVIYLVLNICCVHRSTEEEQPSEEPRLGFGLDSGAEKGSDSEGYRGVLLSNVIIVILSLNSFLNDVRTGVTWFDSRLNADTEAECWSSGLYNERL
jgi:hypothetical protein